MDSQRYPGGCQVVPIWNLVAVWPSEKEEEENIILISDDDDDEVQCPGDDGGGESTQESSVLFVEPQEKSPLEEKKSEELVDEEGDLVVTYCKQANVMPHARHDCTTHPFERTESDTCSPLGKNADICEQCYCYICDKLAAECSLWTSPSLCHCNAHNKSNFWKAQRNFALAGVLATFNLELLELDTELRHGGDLLEKFIKDLSVAYNKYLTGERLCPPDHECCCQPKLPPGQCNVCSSKNMEVVYKYSDVFELVTRFLNQAEQESPKAAAVMLLGAAKQIALHKDPALIITRLQRMLVLCDFPKILYDKFVEFFQSISLPCHCFAFSNSLNVLPWDHMLLTTVLKGQNITGQRKQKGKKTFLWEAFPVVEARVEKLLEKKKYREVVRYLRAVKCNENIRLRDLRDLIPFYLCKTGNSLDAAHSLLIPVNSLACCSACRMTPCQFKVYLKIFRTGCVPSGNAVLDKGPWLTAGKCHPFLFSTRNFIPALPWHSSEGHLSPAGNWNVLAASGNFLEDLKSGVNVSLPSALFSGQKNFWALRLLLDQLACAEHILCGIANLLLRDLARDKGTMLRVWQNLGPQYVGELLCLFLSCRHKRMQSVGLLSLNMIIENLHIPTEPSESAMDEWDLPQWKKEVESLKYQLAYKREMSSKTIPEFVKWIEDGIPEDPFLNPELMKNNPWVEKGKCIIL
ncbi:hypothetical protein TURU_126600 [Turdus rufiventris]|nr:hypothetical protein TURU_126600 [Turdus rufiventris]